MREAEGGRRIERLEAYALDRHAAITLNLHPPGRGNAYHTHDFYEINYVMGGSITEIVSGRAIPMTAGDVILMHPGVFHVVRDDADATVLNILIRPQWFFFNLASQTEGALGQFAMTAACEDYTEYLVFHGAAVTQEMDALIRAASTHTPAMRLAAEGAFLTLLSTLSQTARHITVADKQDGGYRRFAAILSYLYENTAHLDIASLAERFGYSPAHLSRLFRRYTGEAPSTLLIKARLLRAEAMLSEGKEPVCRIAAAVGFPCVPYFHRLFKKTYGITPEEYRRANRRDL